MYRTPIKKWQEQFMRPKGGRAMFSDWSYVTVTPDEPMRPGPQPKTNFSLYDDYIERVYSGNAGRYIPHKRRRHRPTGSGPIADDNETEPVESEPKSLLINGFDQTSRDLMKPAEEEDLGDDEEDEAEPKDKPKDKPEAEADDADDDDDNVDDKDDDIGEDKKDDDTKNDEAKDNADEGKDKPKRPPPKDDEEKPEGPPPGPPKEKTSGMYAEDDDEDYEYYTYDSEIES